MPLRLPVLPSTRLPSMRMLEPDTEMPTWRERRIVLFSMTCPLLPLSADSCTRMPVWKLSITQLRMVTFLWSPVTRMAALVLASLLSTMRKSAQSKMTWSA